jgi:hypothetical protein
MRGRLRIFGQAAFLCLSALPFVAVGPGVVESYHAHTRDAAATSAAASMSPPDPARLFRLPALTSAIDPHH